MSLINPLIPFAVAGIGYLIIWFGVNRFLQPYLEKCTEENAKKSPICKAVRMVVAETQLKSNGNNEKRNVTLS